MEAKRSNMQAPMHGKGQGQAASKTQIVKTASEVSLSPSQAAEQAKVNARKNPLDALSRSSIRHQTVEKRSGLQDVDDEYFKSNVFSRQGFAKHSGLNDAYETKSQTISNLNAAGQSTLNTTESTFKLKTGGDGGAGEQMPSQAQLQQSQSQSQPHAANNAAQLQSQAQMQCKNQTFKETNAMPPPTSAAPANEPQPDMCTTCPNCQTTIYLVRAPEGGHENPPTPHHENSTPAN